MRNYARGVEPGGDRIMSMELKGTVPLTIVSAYAPTAMAQTEDKQTFYTKLEQVAGKAGRRGMAWIGGDFNARVQIILAEEEWMIGNYTFDKENTRVGEQIPEVEESRSMLLGFAARKDMRKYRWKQGRLRWMSS